MKNRTKWIIGLGVLIVGGGVVALSGRGNQVTMQTETVKVQDIKRTVLATGTVTSSVDLDLAPKASGIVKRIPAKVGQKVREGEVLLQLEQSEQVASLASARAAVASAEANLNKVLAGATSEEVAVAQVALESAKKNLADTITQQQVLVKNAFKALYSTGLAAVPSTANLSTVTVTISGSYSGASTANYTIRVLQTGGGWRYEVSGIEGISGYLAAGVPLPITTTGLYATFSAVPAYSSDSWSVEVPNTKASTYISSLNAYNAALETQRSAVLAVENAVASAEANLALKKAQARPADIDAARAQVLSAKAQLLAANAQLENTIVRAPSGGTVTKVDIKVGEQATALKTVVTIQDVSNLYVEANISEANIAQVVNGQAVSYTFDALGSDRTFTGTVTTVDPASTVVSGVVNYKVTASVDQVSEVKPGMTANMSVLVGKQSASLAIPQRAIVERDGKKFVRIITDAKKQTYTEAEVTTGLEADGGLVEIKSGLTQGQVIVTFVEEQK
jgi:HlyD family secretion protein